MVQNSESEELYIICKYGVRSGHYFIGLKVTFYMYSTKKRVALVSAMRADEIQRARGLVLTPWTRPQSAPPVDPRPPNPIINSGFSLNFVQAYP